MLSAPPLSGVAEAVTSYNFSGYDLDPSFGFQAIAPGETTHNATQALALNPETTFFDATIEFEAVSAFANQTIWGSSQYNHSYEYFGFAVDSQADYNGDGVFDLAVSAPGAYSVSGEPSRVEVFYGRSNGTFPTSADLVLTGEYGSPFGVGLAHGDFNSDGFDDLAVSNDGYFTETSALTTSVRIHFGSPSGLSSSYGLEIIGPQGTDWGGYLAGGLDLDGDGYDDLVVSEPRYFLEEPEGCTANCSWMNGRLTVFWGGVDGLSWDNVSYIGEWSLYDFGSRLQVLGDTDGDGADELAVGAFSTQSTRGSGMVYSASPGDRTIRALWRVNGDASTGGFGEAFAGGVDLTGDGLPDLLVGAPFTAGYRGAVYIFAGNGSGGYSNSPVSAISPQAPWARYYYGWALEFLGDIDRDGKQDLAVSQPYGGGYNAAFFLYPQDSLSNATQPALLATYGSYTLLARLGDVNGDGGDDFLESSDDRANGISYPGEVTVFFGAGDRVPRDLTFSVGGAAVLSFTGPSPNRFRAENFSAALRNYLVAHAAEADAFGTVEVTLQTSFSGGGILLPRWFRLSFSAVPTPHITGIVAIDHRPALILKWAEVGTSDVDLFGVWTNHSGNWQMVASAAEPGREWRLENLQIGETVCFQVTATDSLARITSPPSPPVCGRVFDPYPPPIPAGLEAVANDSAGSIAISWIPVGLGVAWVEVWRSDALAPTAAVVAVVPGQVATFVDTGVAEDRLYSYRIRAVSDSGLASGLSSPASASLVDRTPPAAPEGVVATADPGGHSALVQWVSNDPDAVLFVVVYAYRDAPSVRFEVGPAAAQVMRLDGLRAGVDLLVLVVAIDEEGRRSPESVAVSIPLTDTTIPAAPTGVTAIATPEGGALFVSWSPSRDLDVVEYRVYVLDPDAAPVPGARGEVPSDTLSFVLSGLRNRFYYNVYVSAIDSAGHESPLSEAAISAPERQRAPLVPHLDTVPSLTRLSPLEVEGSCDPYLWVELHLDGALAAVAECSGAGRFTSPLTLNEGTNLLTARGFDASPFVRPEWRESTFTEAAVCRLDTIGPEIVWSSPGPSQRSAPADSVIEVAFGEAVDETANSLVVRGEDFEPIDGQISYDASRQILSFRPAHPLMEGGRYSVEVRARDVAGNDLQLYAFSFRVALAQPPEPTPEAEFPLGSVFAIGLVAAATAALVVFSAARRRGGRGDL